MQYTLSNVKMKSFTVQHSFAFTHFMNLLKVSIVRKLVVDLFEWMFDGYAENPM